MQIQGINHITLAISDLDTSLAFYTRVLNCQLLATWPHGADLVAGNLWIALIVDAHCRNQALDEYTHLALDIMPDDFAEAGQAIYESGAVIWKENSSEGDSLYFLDPDGHKLEIHSTRLFERLICAQTHPWEGFQLLVDPYTLQGNLTR